MFNSDEIHEITSMTKKIHDPKTSKSYTLFWGGKSYIVQNTPKFYAISFYSSPEVLETFVDFTDLINYILNELSPK